MADASPMSRASFWRWTLWTTFVVTMFVWGLESDRELVSAIGINVGVFGTLFSGGLGLARTARWRDRLVPLGAGIALASAWPLTHWLRSGDGELAASLLLIVGVVAVLGGLVLCFKYAGQRGWIVSSREHERWIIGVTFIFGVMRVIGWPTGALARDLSPIPLAVLLVALFWPTRNPAGAGAPR